ncbi:uncharacterized protein LOC128305937 [Anopheles moucheti]|uniref:uncharacterized protein LOC128305937 n=1 Tax=Anopheles moucheti TaxID=186751 RepID=UPI0022F023A7|nr:uncharacterized protein LOC128305937 [Anopheles moucheti]
MRFKKCRTFELKLIAAVKRRPELFSFNKIVPTTRWKLIAAWNEVSRLLGVRGERQLPAACDHDAVTHDSTTHQERPWFRIAKVRSMHADSEMTRPSTNANHHPPGELSAKSSTVDRRWTPGTYDGDPHVSYKTIDSDEQFLKSCYTTMKRLSTSQNAFVRVRIQQLLYEAEFPDKNDTSNGFKRLLGNNIFQ